MSFSKDELLYIHRLLNETALYLNEEDGLELDQKFSDYYELDIGPNYAHRSKSEHEEAIKILYNTITDYLSEEHSEPQAVFE